MFPSRSSEFLQKSLQAAQSELGGFCMESGRAPADVQMLPVTKAVDADTTANLYSLGEREFAENRADSLVAKASELAHRGMAPRWHFIGPLQRNKARRVVKHAQVIHSVHSMALLESLERIALEEDRHLEVYLQVHLSGDESKQGFDGDSLSGAAQFVSRCTRLELVGLMAMGPLDDSDGSGTEAVFQACVALGRQLEADPGVRWKHGDCRFSMGMSRDLRAAVAAGTTLVRIGTALYR